MPKLLVSIVIPCRNEEAYIEKVLNNILNQDYQDPIEIIIVDGMSTDRTISIIEAFKKSHQANIKIIPNAKINIPTALNLGIDAAQGQIIIRMDGHAVPSHDYIRIAVEVLLSTKHAVVGGICLSRPGNDSIKAKTISKAISHPFGVGNSVFRIASDKMPPRFVETVPFGCFTKELWERMGGYDENLLTNEDYDFNYRVRQSGEKVYLDPRLKTIYFGRPDFKSLAKQYYRYGTWKMRMLKKYPVSMRIRHFIPPFFIASLLFFLLMGLIIHSLFYIFLIELIFYFIAIFIASIHACKDSTNLSEMLMLPIAFMVMHFSWGGGMLKKLFTRS